MAMWYKFGLEWIGNKPTDDDLEYINRRLNEYDYDAPALTAEGCPQTNWRSPFSDLDKELQRLCVTRGYHFKYYLTYNTDGWLYIDTMMNHEWKYSSPLTERVDKLVKMCEGLTEDELKDLKEVIEQKILDLKK